MFTHTLLLPNTIKKIENLKISIDMFAILHNKIKNVDWRIRGSSKMEFVLA